jgi:hypothetical protein
MRVLRYTEVIVTVIIDADDNIDAIYDAAEQCDLEGTGPLDIAGNLVGGITGRHEFRGVNSGDPADCFLELLNNL